MELASAKRVDREQLVRMDALLGHLLADAVVELIRVSGIKVSDIAAVGSHGLTVGHYPERQSRFGHTMAGTCQIGDGDILAERLGVPVVSDFRKRDMAAGGEGAPLVPLLDIHVLMDPAENRACLNIGGIANITILPAGRPEDVKAFDTGPGNCLLDMAVARLVNPSLSHDPEGQYASRGTIQEDVLERILADPYFRRIPPKSTGREYFGAAYLDHILTMCRTIPFDDVLATIGALTPASIVDALRRFVPGDHFPKRLIVSGGGVHNRFFMNELARRLPDMSVESSAVHGLDPDFKEAMAFGWFGFRTLCGLPTSLPGVTGCRNASILGKISPGQNSRSLL